MNMAETFHMFRLETDTGVNRGKSISSWDLDGWIGTDENKLWIKSEGEHSDGKLEDAEVWAMYSRNIATFWDAQAGIRYDFEPRGNAYFVAGFTGLAQYNFETEAHLFVSERGDVTARLRRENDILLTQKLILQRILKSISPRRMCRSRRLALAYRMAKLVCRPVTNSPENLHRMWMSITAGNSVKPPPSPQAMEKVGMKPSLLSAFV